MSIRPLDNAPSFEHHVAFFRSVFATEVEGQAWEAFGTALARMAADEYESLPLLETAFEAFDAANSEVGRGVTARAAVIAIYYSEASYVGLTSWLRRAAWGGLPPAELTDMSARAIWMTGELVRVYSDATTEYLSEATTAIRTELLGSLLDSGQSTSANARLLAAAALVEFAEFEDDGRLFDRVVAATLPLLDNKEGSPLFRGRLWNRIQCCAQATGPYRGRGRQRIDKDAAEAQAFAVAEEHALNPLRAHLLVARCFYADVSGDDQTAKVTLSELGRSTDFRRPLPAAWFYYLRARAAARDEDATQALLYYTQAVESATSGEAPIGTQQNFLIGLAVALSHVGRWQEAAEHFDRLNAHLSGRDREVVSVRRKVVDFYRSLTESPASSRELRRSILEEAREIRWMSFGLLTPRSTARFLADALREGQEVDFVKQIVLQRDLITEPHYPGAWPWAVRLFGLGQLRIEVNGAKIELGARPQRKPLEVLMLLIALGPQPVPVSTLMDELWPEADGDNAKSSLDMAVLRLRRILVAESALKLEAGHLSLDRTKVWVDAWAFVEDDSVEYDGEFLAGKSIFAVVQSRRDRLRTLYVRRAITAGLLLESSGKREEAVYVYEKALAHDVLAEELHRGVIRCHMADREYATAFRAFRRCRESLSRIGAEPAPATLSLVQNYVID